MQLDIRWMKYALEVHRQQSFTRAAAALRVAQPSLSQQIAKLEQELGLTLFYRQRRSVAATPEGRHFLEKAEHIVSLQEDLVREMQERSQGMGGQLSIGTPAITGEHVLPPLLRAFQRRYPEVQVRFVEESPTALVELTAKGMTDLSILPLPVEDPRLTTEPLLTEPILLALPPEQTSWMGILENCLNEDGNIRKPVPLTDCSRMPFILLKSGYGFRRTVLELCAKAGFQPHIAFETSSIEMAQSLVAHGLGVTLIPHMVRRPSEPRPLYCDLADRPTRTLAFIFRKKRYLSLSARAFVDVCREAGPNALGGTFEWHKESAPK